MRVRQNCNVVNQPVSQEMGWPWTATTSEAKRASANLANACPASTSLVRLASFQIQPPFARNLQRIPTVKKLLQILQYSVREMLLIGKTATEQKVLAARALISQIRSMGPLANFRDIEFKVFSQFGEDGILQYLIMQTKVTPEERLFVEFGAEKYREANSRFLVVNDNWRGLLIDGSARNIAIIRNSPTFWTYDLTTVASFVTAENINSLIENAGFSGPLGLLSIDIDGVDYWVWKALTVVDPVIVVAEYNSVFGGNRAVTVPYDPAFRRRNAHYSDLYFGCSLKALEILGAKKGYALVGSNSAGVNAFFVRRDRLNGLQPLSASEAYVESRVRESRNTKGNFSYVSGADRARLIGHLPLTDIETGETVSVQEAVN